MANNRDDFKQRTKDALALRAGHICSFDECTQVTAGPSREGPEDATMIGVAAHICAAAPGGRRYDPAMTPEQRKHVSNGIWMCPTHSVVIDRDEVTYPAERLREMKARHERERSFDPNASRTATGADIIAIGPNIIGVGAFISADATSWRLRIDHFVLGDALDLIGFIGDFDRVSAEDRYVVVNELGDGRALNGSPSLSRDGSAYSAYDVIFRVAPNWPRVAAPSFGSMLAISPETHDLYVDERGHMGMVAGVDAFRQHLTSLLGLARGDNIFHPKSGTLISQFMLDYAGSPWLDRLIKMEVIRLAAIPIRDKLLKATHTPLRSVNRVRTVQVLDSVPKDQRIPVRVVFDVEGAGRWDQTISVFVYTPEQLAKAANREIPSWLRDATT